MNLADYFEPLNENLKEDIDDKEAWAAYITFYSKKFPDWKKKDLALIGVKDERASKSNKGVANGPDQVRKALYALKKGNGNYRLADLGNLLNGIDAEDTCRMLKEVCETLLQNDVIPVILGATHHLCLGQYLAYESFGKLVNMVNIDAKINLDTQLTGDLSEQIVDIILKLKPNYLFNYNHLAYQSYLNSPATLEILETLYFDAYSVGKMRDDLNNIEPVVRDADLFVFDISAIKMNDAPGNANARVFGLTAEEACQLCWYAGLSEKLTTFGIYEYNPDFDQRGQTAQVIATMIWYFTEGFYNRSLDRDFESNAYVKVIVSNLDNSPNIVFYKHKITQKWWMEVPYVSEITNHQEKKIIACSLKDFETANSGEVPDRWLNTYTKLG